MDQLKPRFTLPKGCQILKCDSEDILKFTQLYFIAQFKLRGLMRENN